jgi:hypothetical protein
MGKWSYSTTFSLQWYQIEVSSELNAKVASPMGERTPRTNGRETGCGVVLARVWTIMERGLLLFPGVGARFIGR